MYVHERSLLQHQTMDLSHGMDATQLGWLSRNWIRLRHEVVRRFHAIDAGTVYRRHRSIERISPFAIASYVAGGNRLRGLDRHRSGGYRDPGNSAARRFCRTDEDNLHCSHRGGRYRAQTGLGKLTLIGRIENGARQ